MTPGPPTPEEEVKLLKVAGLPFVTSLPDTLRIVGASSNGTTIRVGNCDEIFNAALVIDAIEEPGAFRRTAQPVHLETLAYAEQLFKMRVEDALPIWLGAERGAPVRMADRPRVKWEEIMRKAPVIN